MLSDKIIKVQQQEKYRKRKMQHNKEAMIKVIEKNF